MRPSVTAIITVAFAGITAPLAAQSPVSTPSAKPAKTPADSLDRIICRTEESLGSRLNKKRVCLTAREWREMSEGSREATERIQLGQGIVKF